MNISHSSAPIAGLLVGASALALLLAACNKQPNASETAAPILAPPAAALPLAAGPAPTAGPAPAVAALPATATPVNYAPPPPPERYRYIDQAYSMGQAFGDTPPDYAVDYQGTRPWIWRADNDAYRIVERLPQGDREYYYEPGQDYPFLVRDPEYSYAYNGDTLVGVYGPDGAEIQDAIAARRASEAARYLARARELYRAARYQRREAAYASAWAQRRDDLRRQELAWQQEQARNAQWREWHDQHQTDEQRQWRQERVRRTAYASAIGIAPSSGAPRPSATELARRQDAYFAKWNADRNRSSGGERTASRNNPTPAPQVAPAAPMPVNGGAAANRRTAEMQKAQAAAAQAKAAQAAQAQKLAAETQRRDAAAAHANAAQAAHAQQLAAQAQRRQDAAARAKAAQAGQAEKAAAQAKQREAAAAHAKAAQAAQAQRMAARTKQLEAAAAHAKDQQARQAERAAAQAKQREAAATHAKEAQAERAQKLAAQAKQHEAAAAKEKAAQAEHRGNAARPNRASGGKKAGDNEAKHKPRDSEKPQQQ
ncbi:MAG TPA: hypothetical protein VFW39_08785 [Sphingomicrobium sp.]|nr:hypothetical protein [Sphingomicrobium sp.]